MNIEKVARKEIRCLVDEDKKKEIQRRIRFNMIPMCPPETINDTYYDNQNGGLFKTSIRNDTYSVRLRVRNGKLEYIRDYGPITYQRMTPHVDKGLEKWYRSTEHEREDSWDEWHFHQLIDSMGPFEKMFDLSFTRDCFVDKNSNNTILSFDSDITYDGDALFNSELSILHIQSTHDHSIFIRRMIETLGINDTRVSIYKSGIKRYHMLL